MLNFKQYLNDMNFQIMEDEAGYIIIGKDYLP